jgi:acetylornithine/N-succinyldiaminopimelate aminotransferase
MTNDIIAKADRVIAATYARYPLVLTRGEGATVWDADGKAYTDFVAGIAVCNLGHAHPRVADALCRQARTLLHVSNLYYTVPQAELAEWLVERCFADRVFFCNSGAEANEAAIKLARKYFSSKGGARRHRIIAAKLSFHGRTMATLSATGQEKIRKGFDPVLDGFDFVPFNDIEALEERIGETTCAVLLEPIQGEGGIRVPVPGYLKGVREICDRAGALLIFDEIQTGIGRTGRLFAHEHYEVAPDIMTLAKALANGLPIGAMLAREEVAAAFGPGAHATTFGGTPVITAAALESLRVLEDEHLLERCRRTGQYFKQQLIELQGRHTVIAEVRGLGLMLGLELKQAAGPVVTACMQKGFLINAVQDRTLRFVPPLIISTDDVDRLIDCLDGVLGALFRPEG